MYDGITAGNLPTNAEIVAGYVEGRYVWSQADWNRFPNSIKVTIAIWNADADVLDIETGDATPAMAPAWVKRQRERGAFPTVYCNRSTWPAVEKALAGAGFQNGAHYDLWLADYTQQPHCPPYAAACQYADPGPYDLSLCQDYWPRGAQDMPLDPQDPVIVDLRNRLGDLQYYLDPGTGASTQGEVTVRLRSLPALGTALAEIGAKIGAPAVVDEEKLATLIAAKLPPGTAPVDTKALAQAVVNEIGVRVRPA